MLQLVVLHTLVAWRTLEGLERNLALNRKGGGEVGSICLSLFTYNKYQVKDWKFIHKWMLQNSITTRVDILIGMSFLDPRGWNNLHGVRILRPLGGLKLWWRWNRWKSHHGSQQGRKNLVVLLKDHKMAIHATTSTDRSACIEKNTWHDIKSKLYSKCNRGNNPISQAMMDRTCLTGHGSAVQYNVTRQCGSLNEHLLEIQTLLSWSTQRLLAIYGMVRRNCEVLEPFIRCKIHPNVLHGGAWTESELGGSLFHKRVCSKMLSLNITIKIDGNQAFGRQFNTTQFIEASMEHEDFGKELIVKVLLRGEQRWRRFM